MQNYIQPLFFVFTLVSHSAASGCKKACVLDHDKCITKGGTNVWSSVTNSTTGEPLDPLNIEEIDGERGQIQFKLTNITLIGLNKCTLTQLSLNSTNKTYKQYMYCPKLSSTFKFEAKELSNPNSLEYSEQGKAKGTAYKTKTLITGTYGVLVAENDHNPHFFVLTNASRTEFNGKNEISTGEVVFSVIIRRGWVAAMNKIDAEIRRREMGGTFPNDD